MSADQPTPPRPAVPAPTEKKCEGCGTHTTAYKKIHLTNGALVVCEQCLSDINRKNPALVAAEAALNAHKASEQREVEALEELRRRDPALARHVEEEHREHGWVKVHAGHHKVDSMVREAVDENKRLVAALAASREENAELRKLLGLPT